MCDTAIILDPEDFVRLLQVLLHIRALETEEILDPFHLLALLGADDSTLSR